jgi:hypothetical protein
MSVRDKIAKAVMDRIRAFHSSPHDFNKFDLSKVGTGEGAQVYGHGIYAAENPKVSGQGGEYWQNFLERFAGPELTAAETLWASNFDRAKAIAKVRRQIELNEQFLKESPPSHLAPPHMQLYEEGKRESAARMTAMRRRELELLESGKPVGPRTYELDIHGRPEQFIDWDKPMGMQSGEVIDAVRPLVLPSIERQRAARKELLATGHFPSGQPLSEMQRAALKQPQGVPSFETMTGEEAYRRVGLPAISRHEGQIKATEALSRSGVPGIRYLDAGSRVLSPARAAIEPPTSNYVIFDPSKIDIVKKYVVPGALAPMGALAAQDQYRMPELEQPVSP